MSVCVCGWRRYNSLKYRTGDLSPRWDIGGGHYSLSVRSNRFVPIVPSVCLCLCVPLSLCVSVYVRSIRWDVRSHSDVSVLSRSLLVQSVADRIRCLRCVRYTAGTRNSIVHRVHLLWPFPGRPDRITRSIPSVRLLSIGVVRSVPE